MQIPVDLKAALDASLEGVSRKLLSERATRMSDAYRSGNNSSFGIRDSVDALAYVIARMPATYAAVRNSFSRLQERSPTFQPETMLDLGSGPGTASWASGDLWTSLQRVTQVDINTHLLGIAKRLASAASAGHIRNAQCITSPIDRLSSSVEAADLVVLSYAVAELSVAERRATIKGAWERTLGALVIVEPGTPAGYERIVDARAELISWDALIVAPCPHAYECPLMRLRPDWCHFAQRISRSKDHKFLKGAALPYEDEKFSYVIAVRDHAFTRAINHRIIARPQVQPASYSAKLCTTDGEARIAMVAKRNKVEYSSVKKLTWGDQYPC